MANPYETLPWGQMPALTPEQQKRGQEIFDFLNRRISLKPSVSATPGVGGIANMSANPAMLAPATIPPQTGTPTVPGASSPLQAKPAIPQRATVPTVGPTLANAAGLGMPNLPNFLNDGGAAPARYPTAAGPGAGGLSPVTNTPGIGNNPYQMYSRPEAGGLDVSYTMPQGRATFLGGTGDGTSPGQNALGLTLGQRGQGTLSAVSGPSAEQQAATAQNVAGIESQIAALQSLSAARNGSGAGAFGDLISFGAPGGNFGDEQMAANRKEGAMRDAAGTFGRGRRAAAMQAAAAMPDGSAPGARYLPGPDPGAAAQARQARQQEATMALERAKLGATERQNAFQNELGVANYLNDLGKQNNDLEKTKGEVERQAQLLPSEKAKGQLAQAKAQMEAKRAEIYLKAAQGNPESLKLLSSLPGGNDAALMPWLQ